MRESRLWILLKVTPCIRTSQQSYTRGTHDSLITVTWQFYARALVTVLPEGRWGWLWPAACGQHSAWIRKLHWPLLVAVLLLTSRLSCSAQIPTVSSQHWSTLFPEPGFLWLLMTCEDTSSRLECWHYLLCVSWHQRISCMQLQTMKCAS